MSQFREVAIALKVIVYANLLLRKYSQMNLLFRTFLCMIPCKTNGSQQRTTGVVVAKALRCLSAWEGDVSDGLRFPTTYCLVSKISKRLDLEPNMNKVRQAMNIPPDFREWHWLLSEYRMEECGLPQARAIEIWKLFSPELVDQPDEMAEKVKSGAIPLSCARVKHVVGADSRNIYGMRNIRGDVRMSSLEKSKTSDLPCKDIFTRSIPSDERWTTANFDYKGSRSFKAWVAAVRRAKESSTRVKNSTSVHVHCPKDVKCDLIPIDIDVETEAVTFLHPKWRELRRLLGTALVSESFMGSTFRGVKHSIVLALPSFPGYLACSFLCPQID
ncbi:hypothetical protein L3X38_003995 [Prunus dulcis]|uniref:Uncharacterized protein n=1 Tax=Prunus dulcis TaxID=3755 RepID=A0AAD4ZN49_PRUDU|nr:hypothetical protein L3X38_003995 [Prunus dulcis]